MPEAKSRKRKNVKEPLHMADPHGGYRETTIEERVRLLACWTDWADTKMLPWRREGLL